MKYVDKFVLVPVEKWDQIVKKENKIREESYQSPSTTIVTQAQQQQKMKKKETLSPLSHLKKNSKKKKKIPQTSKQTWTQIIQNKKIKNLKGKGESNLPTSKITENILSRVPRKYKNRVAAFLHYLKRSPDLKWTKNGTIFFKGKKIDNSNIGDLTFHAVNEQEDNSTPDGYKIFYEHIIDAGVPLFFVKNKLGLKIIYKTLQEVDDNWRPPGKLIKKYKVKKELDWDSIK